MIKVGGSYNNTAKESKKEYIQVGFDEALLPITITKDHVLTLHTNESKEKLKNILFKLINNDRVMGTN